VWYDRPSKFSYLPHSFFSLLRVCNIFVQTFLNIYTRILKCWSHFWDNYSMFEKIIVIKFSIGTQARKGFFQNLKAKFSTKVVNVRKHIHCQIIFELQAKSKSKNFTILEIIYS
jgi:hypothetical protein